VPNQPLYFADEDHVRRKEDQILAYSMDKYLDTGDEEWPVHLAMTKSVVRAMDAIQDYLRKEDVTIDDFILMGGSKRGWTTWLTAAVDPRVRAILPISIDMLNLNRQFPRHWDAYGFYAHRRSATMPSLRSPLPNSVRPRQGPARYHRSLCLPRSLHHAEVG
jgi:PhoPQ-activated pathogenicity-related protein